MPARESGHTGSVPGLETFATWPNLRSSMRIPARSTVVLVLALAVTACAAPNRGTVRCYEDSHLLRWDHPTHGIPARVGFFIGGIVGNFLLSPFAFVEAIISNRDSIHDDTGPFHYASAHVAGGFAWVLGGPFYLLGLPFEPGEETRDSRGSAGPEDERDLKGAGTSGPGREVP